MRAFQHAGVRLPLVTDDVITTLLIVLLVLFVGIREVTILGQAIGLALRGLRPIAEIQYLDYILYALQLMSDDLATLRWRTHGGQKAPVIVRTRGHRLEGVWHSGSLMAGVIHLARGMYVLTPRNMTQAAGFYNTLLEAEEPAVLVEVLNAYRTRERLPDNIGEFRIPVGVPEILRLGDDVTIVNCLGYHIESSNVDLDGNSGTTTLWNSTFMDAKHYNISVGNPNHALHMYNCIMAGGDSHGLYFEQMGTNTYRGDYNVFHNDNASLAIAANFHFSLEGIEKGAWTVGAGL